MASNTPVTEVATLFLEPGTDLQDKSSPAYRISREAISVIANQPGFQRAYYGHHLEDRSKADLVIGAYLTVLNSARLTGPRDIL